MKLKDLAGLDNTLNDLSRYAKSPFIFNQQQEASMSNYDSFEEDYNRKLKEINNIRKSNTTKENHMFRETSAKDLEDKIKSLEDKLDLILAKLNPNPEDLLSTSEINMMESWRTQANAMESDNTPTFLSEYRTNESDNTPSES